MTSSQHCNCLEVLIVNELFPQMTSFGVGETKDIIVKFNPLFEEGENIRIIDQEMSVTYDEHPQTVKLLTVSQ